MQNPTFFVPAATPENIESVYAQFAQSCNRDAPAINERIYSITFVSNGEVWTATVGETLSGFRTESKRKKGKTVERTHNLSDSALVLAIFPGAPYMVVTNHGIGGNVGSRWANPFLAGEPSTIVKFHE